MKKSYLVLSLALLAMTGCSQNEIMETSPDAHRTIGFGVYTGVQTKGLITDNSETDGTTANGLKASGKGFGIMAYLTKNTDYAENASKSVFMDNQQVTWNTTAPGSWTYSPVKYWPDSNTDRLSFFAYAPYSTGGANGISLADATNTANPKLTFTLQNSQNALVDLVASTPTTDGTGTINRTSANTANAVTFSFKHVLTRITMTGKTAQSIDANALTKVYITGIKLTSSNKLAKNAVYDMYTEKWTLPADGSTNYNDSYVLADGAGSGTGVLNMAAASGFGNYNKSSIEINETAKSLFTANQYLFFIPVGTNGAGTAAGADVKAEITYDVVTLPKTGASTATYTSTTKTVDLGTGVFAQGKAYSFDFTVGLNEIKVTVTDFNWETTLDKPVTVN